jgi:ketosteroid isomerase-like protein
MDFGYEGEVLDSPDETTKAFIQKLHHTLERKDFTRIAELVDQDVFVLGSAADAVFNGKDEFLTCLQGLFSQLKYKELHLQRPQINIGLCNSGRSAWFLDRFEVSIKRDKEPSLTIPIRLTGLLVREHAWRLSAASWSIPMRDNDYQYELLAARKLPPGVTMENRVSPAAQPLAENIHEVMAQSSLMPALYSARPDAFTIGSTVDEVFFGTDGKNFVNEIVQLPLKFAVRGGIQSAVSPDGCTAWLAANIDLSGGLTVPYRFFYVWLREPDGWQIVVSHDSVCIDPFDPFFDYS